MSIAGGRRRDDSWLCRFFARQSLAEHEPRSIVEIDLCCGRRVATSIWVSPVVYPDETGWRVGGIPAWLWAVTKRRERVYAIHRGRGYAETASILGEDFAGPLLVDGWAPYRCLEHATMKTYLADLLRRCHEMLETATRAAVRCPRQVQAHLQHALALRDRRDAGEIGGHGLGVAQGRLQAAPGRTIRGRFGNPDNGRLARHFLR